MLVEILNFSVSKTISLAIIPWMDWTNFLTVIQTLCNLPTRISVDAAIDGPFSVLSDPFDDRVGVDRMPGRM